MASTLFLRIFEIEAFPTNLNQKFIFFIPKQIAPESIHQFRPISLCNTIYKIFTKIIVNRLRPFLSKIIDPLQNNFLPNQRAFDNYIIVQETINCFHKRHKSQSANMTINLDLEKDFDKIE